MVPSRMADLVHRSCSPDESFEFIDYPETNEVLSKQDQSNSRIQQFDQSNNGIPTLSTSACSSIPPLDQSKCSISSSNQSDNSIADSHKLFPSDSSCDNKSCYTLGENQNQGTVTSCDHHSESSERFTSIENQCNEQSNATESDVKLTGQRPQLKLHISHQPVNSNQLHSDECSDINTTKTDTLDARLRKCNLSIDISQSESSSGSEELPTPVLRRGKPLDAEDFQKLLDEDGRLVDEHSLRKAVFMGGVDPSIRKDVWQFLFGLYPCSSTTREREELLLDYIMKYHEQKSRWKTMLVVNAKPGASLLQQGLVARYQIEDANNMLKSPDAFPGDHISEFEMLEKSLMSGKMKTQKPDFNALSKNFKSIDVSSPEMQQKIDFMKIQAQVYVNRHKVDIKNLWIHLRTIDKDVPRTDRDLPYFSGAMNPNLTVLRNILITFAAFHPDIGYAQGMNDILAQFLFVFDSEVEAYWCFRNYLQRIQYEFTEEGMMKKIDLVVMLLQEMDSVLLDHLKSHDLGDLLFCHRWLLLGFKREFKFLDALQCFEILSSHHLELTSMEAEKARRVELKKEFENLRGVTRTTTGTETGSEYTFELFMCIALLQECRDKLLECTDTAMVFSIINHIEIDLDDILVKSAMLFYLYCKKSVEDSFLMVDSPTSPDSQKLSVFALKR